jgi:hypothetical protein
MAPLRTCGGYSIRPLVTERPLCRVWKRWKGKAMSEVKNLIAIIVMAPFVIGLWFFVGTIIYDAIKKRQGNDG